MFGVGTWEIIVILVIAMTVFGPERMVVIARQFGEFVRKFRSESDALTKEFREAIELEELEKAGQEIASIASGTETSAKKDGASQSAASQVAEATPASGAKTTRTEPAQSAQAQPAPTSAEAAAAPVAQTMELDEALVMEIGLAAALVDGEIEVESETAAPPGAEYAVPQVIRAGEFVAEDSEAEPTSLPGPELVADDDDSADGDALTEDVVIDVDQASQDEDSVPASADQASQDTD